MSLKVENSLIKCTEKIRGPGAREKLSGMACEEVAYTREKH